jgi:hypothetical protein
MHRHTPSGSRGVRHRTKDGSAGLALVLVVSTTALIASQVHAQDRGQEGEQVREAKPVVSVGDASGRGRAKEALRERKGREPWEQFTRESGVALFR